ncbi:MAG: YggS family pyridoxal phosphate-dependent enzyme, partial [Desulfobacteraceae bacterium]
AVNCGRPPHSIRLVAVAKTQPVEIVKKAIENGATIIGENYIQEARDKFNALSNESVDWHFIGHLQTNKAKYAARMFELIHSVDSLKLAAELNKQAAKLGKQQNILIQVNISQESSKSGVTIEDTVSLIRQITEYKHINIHGLMTMPPYFDEPEKARPFFRALRKLSDKIKKLNLPRVSMEELSMGMTGDFKAAIEEGATLVRIGTAIFGERQ